MRSRSEPLVSASAWWLSPVEDGSFEIVPVARRHIQVVCENPERFGLTAAKVRETFRRFREPIGVEGRARVEIMADLLRAGWVRARRAPNVWTIEFASMADERAGAWARVMLEALAVHPEDELRLVTLAGGASRATFLELSAQAGARREDSRCSERARPGSVPGARWLSMGR